MIWKIIRKEFLTNLLTFRFAVGSVLLLALTIIFSSILLSDYGQNLEEYHKFVSKNDENLRQLMTYQNLKPFIYKPPEALTLFSKGIDENVSKSAQVSLQEIPSLTSAASTRNPLLSVFAVLDITLVFKLVISVLAFLLAYDAVTGEKEDGTLRLMFSNSVPRFQVLLGKFLGAMLTLAIPISLGFIAAVLMMEVSPLVELTGGDLMRIVLMLGVSLIMVSVFFNIGLFVSSLTKRASDTLMWLLFLWVAFLLILPNSSSYLASRMKPVESADKINAQVHEIRNRLQKEIRNIYWNTPEEGNFNAESDRDEPWGYYIKFATRGVIQARKVIISKIEPLKLRGAQEIGDLNRGYLGSLMSQKNLADGLSKMSPISLYEKLMSSLSRTDVSSLEDFAQQARRYRQQLIDYFNKKNAFLSQRYFSTLKEEYQFDANSGEEYMRLYKKYGEYDPVPLDISDLPQFRYLREGEAKTLIRILPDFLLLAFMSIFFFMCAFVAVLKYDVR